MSASDARTAIVLLHGIGDQHARYSMSQFTSAVERLGIGSTDTQKLLREPASDDGGISYFIADTTIGDKKTRLAEFYWADLSRVRRGPLSILRNFFQLVTDAPDIVYACLGPRLLDDKKQDYVLLRMMRAFLALVLWVIYFPIIAINLAYAVLVGEFAFHSAMLPGVTLDTPADQPFVIMCLLSVVFLGGLVARFGLSKYFQALCSMMLFVLAGVGGFAAYNTYIGTNPFSYGDYATYFNEALNALWFFVIVCSLVYLALLPILCLFFRRRWRGILLGFMTTFLVVRFWLLLITTLWLVYMTSIFESRTYDSLVAKIGGPIRFVSLVWFEVAIVGLVLLGVLVVYSMRTVANRDRITGRSYPRLIMPSILPLVCICLALVGVSVVVLCNCALVLPQCTSMQCRFVFEPSEIIIARAATFLAIGGILIQASHSGFEVAIDIVNYFKSDCGHRRINPVAAMTSVFRYDPVQMAEFRSRLNNRLGVLTDDLVKACGPFDRIVLVGHSLGSMIAIDNLMQRNSKDGLGEADIDLITLGSPYTHVFNHYFPHMFAPAGSGLLPSVSHWTNIFRENDYVGTRLTDGKTGVEEHPQLPKGHLDYFADDDVARVICSRITRDATV